MDKPIPGQLNVPVIEFTRWGKGGIWIRATTRDGYLLYEVRAPLRLALQGFGDWLETDEGQKFGEGTTYRAALTGSSDE